MLEQRRLDYLQAMGVVQWMARKPLAQGPEPRWWPQEAANAELEQAQQAANQMAALLGDNAPEAQPTNNSEIPAKPHLELVHNTPPLTVEPQPIPEFKLYFLACQLPVVWVTDNAADLPSLQRFVFALQKALLGKAYHLYEPVEFKWPFLRSTREDQSEAVALQALKAQWQVFSQQHPVQAVSFGSISQQWLEKTQASLLMHYSSLTELLTDAEHKKALWLSLSSLNLSS